jgi:hypothetical protein
MTRIGLIVRCKTPKLLIQSGGRRDWEVDRTGWLMVIRQMLSSQTQMLASRTLFSASLAIVIPSE